MKLLKLTVTIAALLVATNIFAQVKIGYVRIDDIVGVMPELAPDRFSLDTVGNKYVQDSVMPELNRKQSQYTEKMKAYADTSKKQTDAAKKMLMEEIMAIQNDLNSADAYIQQVKQARQQLFLQPFYDKARTAIQQVAKEKGYTHVLSTDVFVVAPEADDLSLAVLQKLNIKIAGQNAPAPGPAVKKKTN